MCFSLFKSKPKQPPPPSSSSRHSTPPSTTNNTTTSNIIISNSSTAKSSSSSSKSSRTSLSSLKSTLLLPSNNPHIYDISLIRSATNNFLLPPLSSSSSSTLWLISSHPSLPSSSVITQRKLRRPLSSLRPHLSLLSKLHHASLVPLRGASLSSGSSHIFLLHDFIPGASLSHCLRNPINPSFTVLSNWLHRITVAATVADGLHYMHNCVGIKGGLVHNHIKTSSIIISDEPALTAKICHFGTAQLCGEVPEGYDNNDDETDSKDEEDECRVLKRVGSGAGKFEGTRGYMSPEYQLTGIPTLKSDVFAFGVVVLELLSGEEPVKVKIDQEKGVFQKVSLIEMAKEAVAGGRLRQWVDRRLKDSYPVEVAQGLTKVALECVQDDPRRRPNMGRVAGWISKLFLESKSWAQSIGIPDEITVSFAPR